MSGRMRKGDQRYLQGIALAVVRMAKDFDQPGLASNVLWKLKLRQDLFEAAALRQFDLAAIRGLYRRERQLRSFACEPKAQPATSK